MELKKYIVMILWLLNLLNQDNLLNILIQVFLKSSKTFIQMQNKKNIFRISYSIIQILRTPLKLHF